MVHERKTAFLAGVWRVDPETNTLLRDGEERHVEPKVMKVLLTLASQQNHVVSKEDLITAVWPDTFVGDDVLTRCISILRKITEDDPHAPHFIQTVPKVGYRLVAPVSEFAEPEPMEVLVEQPAAPLEARPAAESIVPPAGAARWPRARWIAGAAAALSLVAATGYGVHARREATGPSGSLRTVQFTSYDGEQTQPAFSPDGAHIAFVWAKHGSETRQIYVKRIGEENLTRLAKDGGEQFSPVWSPDGRQIAYLGRSSDGLGLYITGTAPGSGASRIYIPQQPSHWEQGALSWSPDGKSLIFPDHDGSQPHSSLFQLDLATRNVRSITSPPSGWEGDLNPAYSPDGTKIAFTRASETAVRDIYWISVGNGAVHQLTSDRMNIDSLTWSADGRSILFSSNRGGKYALWKMALNGGKPERLPVGSEDAFGPAVGPRPGQLAYAQGSAFWSILRLRGAEGKSAAVPERVLSSTQQDSAPSLSPDGRFFAIQSLRSGSQEIWISSIEGKSLRQLTFLGGPLTGSPAWSNHGDSLLFDSRPDGHSHIFSVPVGGGQPKQLTSGNANDIVPRWSHDDQKIYFRSNRGGRWQLWMIPAAGGEPQPVTTGDGIEPQESPDGRWLYYTRGNEDGLWRTPVGGGNEVQVSKAPAAGFWGYWQVTPLGIFYLDQSHTSPEIRILNPETRESSLYATLQQTPPPYAGISVVAQGHIVLMTDEHDAERHITLVERQR
ncbi:component of the Tol biopolymer transport system [Granulicella pectinivorans]|uniref:Component of the Tol biopolymer transport system n=2 Tax=Granulicella pectinivorans TaxID=474950 RepID=A0A1I6LD03_9BACT|nr:component of the Tol biopolymer transport system [Granulicella pectinivorans]